MHILIASLSTSPATLVASLATLGVHCDEADGLGDLASVLALSGPYDALVIRMDGPAGEVQAAICELRRQRSTAAASTTASTSPRRQAKPFSFRITMSGHTSAPETRTDALRRSPLTTVL